MQGLMCVTDLDGTLLRSDRKISDQDIQTLELLGQKGVIRVLATGRSLWSLLRVVSTDAPFDFAIVSTGAGIMNWKTQELIHSANLNSSEIGSIYQVLEKYKFDYMIHQPVPDTHFMHYREIKGLRDFWERIDYYKAFSQALDPSRLQEIQSATQFLAIAEPEHDELSAQLCAELAPFTAIRTLSPIDYVSFWIEVLSSTASKGKGLIHLAKMLHCDVSKALIIGNDFNDEDMLHLSPYAYVPENAAAELKDRFNVVSHCDRDAFSEAVGIWQKAMS